jgi:hypothetical protein
MLQWRGSLSVDSQYQNQNALFRFGMFTYIFDSQDKIQIAVKCCQI